MSDLLNSIPDATDKLMKTKRIDSFRERHPIVVNLLLMFVATCVLIYIALLFIDVFTDHGRQRQVPDVRSLSLGEAIEKVEAAGMAWDISDSTQYDRNFKPGVVIDQDPKAGSFVKPTRAIYFKVNAMHDRKVALPRLVDISSRQAVAMLRTQGFKDIVLDSVRGPSSSRGVVLQVKVDGHSVADGTSVLVSSNILLVVCDGSIDDTMPDTIVNSVLESLEVAGSNQQQ